MNPIKNKSNTEEKQMENESTPLAVCIGRVKLKLVAWLTHQTGKLSMRGKKITLLLFGSIMATTSIMLIIKSFQLTTRDASILPQRIEVPQMMPPTAKGIMTNDEFKMLLQFTHMMDSLKSTHEGAVIHDSILRDRPGLMDSINFLIQIYRDQQQF